MSFFRTPIVVVLGATGAGKSKLALELAQKFKGEIINADAMQMYHGLNIATNKVTDNELKSVKHHMIDMLDPINQIAKVSDFRNACLPIMEDLLHKGVIPFICGGTNYYIESLLWNILVDNCDSEIPSSPYQGDDDLSVPTDQLYAELLRLDPERADTLHRNDRRKIYRSLQVYYRHGGKKHSEFIKEQRAFPGGSHVGGPLRYKNVCFLWVDTEVGVLNDRCNRRVDKMIERGLLKELEDFNREYNLKRKCSSDYTVGIFQSIGFKEFHDYLMLDDEAKGGLDGERLYEEGVAALKSATHRYARRQIRWIRQRLLNPLNMSHLPVYRVDSTDPSKWQDIVYEPSVEIVQSFVEGKSPSMEPVPLLDKPNVDPKDLKKIFSCDACEMQFKGIIQYEIHMKSKKHKSISSKKKLAIGDTPLYSLRIEIDKEHFKEPDTLALIKILKRVSKGVLTSSDIYRFLKGSEALDIKVSIKEFGAKKIIEELKGYNVIGHMIPLLK